MPSSSRVKYTWAGEASRKRSSGAPRPRRPPPRGSACSSARAGAFARLPARAWSRGSGWPGPPHPPAGRRRAEEGREIAEAVLDHGVRFCCSLGSSLSASSCVKSPDAFPWISSASLCRRSWPSRRAVRRRRRSTSRASSERFFEPVPVLTPASVARFHSTIWLV